MMCCSFRLLISGPLFLLLLRVQSHSSFLVHSHFPPDRMVSVLDQLKKVTTVVADTGDFKVMKQFLPTDATTNPSLILAASKMDEYSALIDEAISYAKQHTQGQDKSKVIEAAMDRGAVCVEGRGLGLSFDTDSSVSRALSLISQYEAEGIPKERILIKLASTWEGIQAAKILESKHGIHCNMTLLFGYEQAIACAQVGATLISPFVGRIMDWYVKNTDKKSYDRNDDPGVKSVNRIYTYYKKFGHKTQVMAASFRNTEEIKGLVGCDLLTIAPTLLKQLAEDHEEVPVKLSPSLASGASEVQEIAVDEKVFRWALNEDAMATEKLAEGIRNFAKDARLLEDLIRKRL